jgi:hypothetical protein
LTRQILRIWWIVSDVVGLKHDHEGQQEEQEEQEEVRLVVVLLK